MRTEAGSRVTRAEPVVHGHEHQVTPARSRDERDTRGIRQKGHKANGPIATLQGPYSVRLGSTHVRLLRFTTALQRLSKPFGTSRPSACWPTASHRSQVKAIDTMLMNQDPSPVRFQPRTPTLMRADR